MTWPRRSFTHTESRLANNLPQQTNQACKTVLERAVDAGKRGDLSETAAIDLVERQGFSDVVPRFHTGNGDPIPLRFYETPLRGSC